MSLLLLQLKIFLIDFAWLLPEESEHTNHCPFSYAEVSDQKTDKTVRLCGGGKRKLFIVESFSPTVKVVISDEVKGSNKQFLIQFEGK